MSLVASAGATAKAVELKPAQPVSIVTASGKAHDEAVVKEAIIAGGAVRGWLPESEAPGRVVLRNVIRGKHTVVVAVVYKSDSLKVEYVDSDNLNFKERNGKRYIHPKYQQWVDAMVHDIRLKLPMR
ncbi:MAG TPA: hypothetical protein VFY12_05505 [Arenimonas sp.]|nr:hypothetical protein [Arenimonas sp.]